MTETSPEQVRRVVLQRLESLARAGVTGLPRAAQAAAAAPERAAAPSLNQEPGEGSTQPAAAAPQDSSPPPGKATVAPPSAAPGTPLFSRDRDLLSTPPLSADQRVAALAEVCRDVAACQRCPELVANRTQTVFGVGIPTPRLVFLGEAPGAEEDAQGEPFVGRAGELLNRILHACTLRREDVYILNILKCRPPGNRTPTPQEAENCREFLLRQLAILRPEFICCLGAVAAQNLLGTTTPIGRLRGRFYEFQGIRVMATYHPAYLLRNPSAKSATWEDMKMLMREMGIQLPKS